MAVSWAAIWVICGFSNGLRNYRYNKYLDA